ncbi:DUF3131 domain-containing protein [Shewanella sp. c952]|uniref:DUF3131 domain-containing protein n=1 Tax=Shewanella sp. c952 TaxID=2815913 RepID=UPI0021806708|nr:DUF3131 domain-containing protein [Shewanella sp. c952]
MKPPASLKSILQIAVCSFIILSAATTHHTWANNNKKQLDDQTPASASPQRVSRVIQGSEPQVQVQIEFQRRAVIPQANVIETSKAAAITANSQSPDSTVILKTNILPLTPKPISVPLNRHEKLLINKAQRYIDKNWNEETGMIDSVQGYTHATMWDVASGIGALLALEALGVSDPHIIDIRLAKLLNTLYELPLYDDKLPNRQYNTVTGKPSGNFSQTPSNGNGWSALDLGRLYIWLTIVAQRKPHLAMDVDNIKFKWQLNAAVHNKTLYGTKLTSKKEYFRQEGRLGYLQYAATGYQMMNLDVAHAFSCKRLQQVDIDSLMLKIDTRNLPFLTLDPFLLYTIEIGNKASCWNQLDTLFKLHNTQYQATQRLTAYAEDSLSKSPWFLYNNIYYQGQAWHSVSHSGKAIADSQIFSNKAAFAMSVIFQNEYSQNLAIQVITNSARHQEVPTGLYRDGKTNTAYNINTNSLILVSLWYKMRGRKAIWQE